MSDTIDVTVTINIKNVSKLIFDFTNLISLIYAEYRRHHNTQTIFDDDSSSDDDDNENDELNEQFISNRASISAMMIMSHQIQVELLYRLLEKKIYVVGKDDYCG